MHENVTIQDQLEWLVANTTVLWIERNNTHAVVSGVKVEIDRFSLDQGSPVSFSHVLEPLWQAKFDSFGDEWNAERQKYRLLYDAMKAFFTSFIGLRLNKVASIEAIDDTREALLQGELAGSHLIQMYMSGKKSLDLIIRDLGLPVANNLAARFIETRNKLFEHNHNPNQLPDLILEPLVWGVMATNSRMTVHIHTTNEREYDAFIDYYQDYYNLEEVFVNVVQNLI